MIIIELYVDHRSEGVSIRGHGFDSRSSLNFFRFLLFNRLSAVQIYEFHILMFDDDDDNINNNSNNNNNNKLAISLIKGKFGDFADFSLKDDLKIKINK